MSETKHTDPHVDTHSGTHSSAYDDGRDALARYVLVEHLRATGAEFDVYATALDHSTWDHRIINAAATLALGLDDSKPIMVAASRAWSFIGTTFIEAGKWHDNHWPVISICDRDRVVAAVLALDDDDAKTLLGPPFSAETETREEAETRGAAATAIVERIVATIGKFVTLKAFGQIRITEGTVEGATPRTRTYAPGVAGGDRLELSDCAIRDAGVRIEPVTGNPAPGDLVISVRNGLPGRTIVLESADAKPRRYEVVSSGTVLLYARDLKVAWSLTLQAKK